jgi:RNA binding exosome subunit
LLTRKQGENKLKKWLVVPIVGLLMSILIGCSSDGPKDTVKEFLTAIQKGDFAKASTFVGSENGDFDFNKMNETVNGIDGKEMFSAITKNYEFKEPVEVSKKDDTAEVKVEITSVDMGAVLKKTIEEMVSTAFANTIVSGGKEPSKKEMEEQMMKNLLEKLSDKDSKMITREVTLNVKKDTDGNYKIAPDEKLAEALIANAQELEKALNKK